MSSRVAKLIMVTAENNNKFYDMQENSDGGISVAWGRVDVTRKEKTYRPGERKWETLHRSKVKKGYVDHTELRTVSSGTVSFSDIKESAVRKIVDELQRYANKSVSTNYTVSSEAVTQKQIDAAQDVLNVLAPMIRSGQQTKGVNDRLIELYGIIPRKMKKVQYHLLQFDRIERGNLADAEKMLATEQATLDVMRGQVGINQAKQTMQKSDVQKTILDAMGIGIALPNQGDIREIKKQLGGISSQYRDAYVIINTKTQSKFDGFVKKAKNKTKKLFWHGSRNENWWSIIESGLILRPTNAVITGKMFGYGVYFADRARKSLGYTSLRGSYWARGSANKGFMSLYVVHLGRALELTRHQSWCYDLNKQNLRRRGDYDSLFARGGADLRNNEFIVYDDAQCTIKYLVELG